LQTSFDAGLSDSDFVVLAPGETLDSEINASVIAFSWKDLTWNIDPRFGGGNVALRDSTGRRLQNAFRHPDAGHGSQTNV
jgi:hypothetical protein